MDMGTCCAYFCTGVSGFGILTLIGVTLTLKNEGGAHYISEDFALGEMDAAVAAKATSGAIIIYLAFFLFCGYRVYSMNKAGPKQITEEAE